ncbi:hypothetical protein HLV37_06015 [Eggerthellaceae bacterium zg-1084]|uniref:hypothetical protein n=1 Tax=Berryella wangjianweii TaxID=2734634 RepID=UPI001554515B|nr:hypothetical protein [Berryella wangjianweii]NPD31418.1 hypothetical protein [Berryella wangjianweii]NPD32275.1 hypothetical protein [Eggerthellaceae bacterium zg-997]
MPDSTIDPALLERMADELRSRRSARERERAENERRAQLLSRIATRIRSDGPHQSHPHPDRARQFMPFAALKGLDALIEAGMRAADESESG